MQRQESLNGPWPIVPCPRDYEFLPGSCKLMIVKGCRHHIASLKCCLPEESLCSLPTHSSLSFPGQFVLSQIMVALGSDKQELFECHMEASRNGNFQINGGRYVIEAEVKPPGRMHLAETAAVDCAGNALPSYAGTFIFLLPANVSSIFHINIKFKSVAGNELLHEVQTCVLTHYAPNHLFDYWDGHSLPVVDLPFAKKQLVGILGTPEGQKAIRYFQDLVENGAYQCFKRDQLHLIQHSRAPGTSEALYKDLLLAVRLEESLLLYQMGDLEGCKQVCEDVCIQANDANSPNYNAIAGRAKSIISGAYKMEKDFVKAEEFLNSSTELLEAVVPGEETSVNRTCVAALYSEKARVEGISKQEKKILKKATKDAMLHFRHQLDRNLNRNARSPRRAIIRAIFFYLHSSRDKATNLQIPVSADDLAKVDMFVRQFRRGFLADCPMRDKALFYSALGDLFTRKGQFEEGISWVSEASRIAADLQLQADIKGTRDRMLQLDRLRLDRGEIGPRRPREMAEETMVRNLRFQEPQLEVLQGHLDELTRVLRC